MIEMNESYIIDDLSELGMNGTQIREFLRRFSGIRIYIRKKKSEYDEIVTLYNQIIENGAKRSDAIHTVSGIFEKSESRIREITRTQEDLFEF